MKMTKKLYQLPILSIFCHITPNTAKYNPRYLWCSVLLCHNSWLADLKLKRRSTAARCLGRKCPLITDKQINFCGHAIVMFCLELNVQPWEHKQTNKQTDRRTDASKCIISLASRSIKRGLLRKFNHAVKKMDLYVYKTCQPTIKLCNVMRHSDAT